MAIQPIDLQTMYSQLGNVANKVAHSQQGAQLFQSMNQVNVIKQNAEQAAKVQKTNENSKSVNVNKDGRNEDSADFSQKKNEKDKEKDSEEKSFGITESFLGVHVDISG